MTPVDIAKTVEAVLTTELGSKVAKDRGAQLGIILAYYEREDGPLLPIIIKAISIAREPHGGGVNVSPLKVAVLARASLEALVKAGYDEQREENQCAKRTSTLRAPSRGF